MAVAGALAQQPAPSLQEMVVTAHPLATQASHGVLEAGGNAVDAAIAAQMMLTLVEPQSSGIGGGAFLVHYRASDSLLQAFDGRETAPAAAGPDLFLRPDGSRMEWSEARVGGRSVGVPGTVRMLALAHEQHGALPWAELFRPAIHLARDGFQVTERLHEAIARVTDWEKTPSSAFYFLNAQGEPWPVGHRLRNPALAEVLEALAATPHGLNVGPIAEKIVEAVQGFAANPGRMTLKDLAGYDPKVREPVCGAYLVYRLCGMPPPSSGPLTVLIMLGLAERHSLHDQPPDSIAWAHLFAEAGKVAFADRNHYMADPDFVAQPVEGLLNGGYLDQRAALISRKRALGKVDPGSPPGDRRGALPGPHEGLTEKGTSHLSIVDDEGNIVSMTTTIESAFGSRLMVAGFLLNNELTDFSFVPERNGKLVANRVEPRKRPRSSMAPMIAFDGTGDPAFVTGSPGGSRIIAYVAGSIVRVLGNGVSPQAAVESGHVVNRNSVITELEEGRAPNGLAAGLETLGHQVKLKPLTSGLHVIRISRGQMVPGVDPRREGLALGD